MRKKPDGRGLPQSVALRIASIAVLTAVTTVLTLFARIIPWPPTGGYLHLGDLAVYFSAFTFGPLSAMFAGGLGTAFADLFANAAQFAPVSLLAHGLQGLLAGLLCAASLPGRKRAPFGRLNVSWILAAAVGTLVMCVIYFGAEIAMVGLPAALSEIPINLLQSAIGILGGIPLSLAVRKAYPPVAELRW